MDSTPELVNFQDILVNEYRLLLQVVNNIRDMTYSRSQGFFLILMRLFIGWHFFYEGLVKLFNPGWTAKGYLLSAEGFLAPLFNWLGESSFLAVSDWITTLVLLVVGLCLLLGFREKLAAFVGMALIALFYLAHPSWPGLPMEGPAEGNYLIVNKNLIEIAALGVLAFFPTGHLAGLDVFRNAPKRELASS